MNHIEELDSILDNLTKFLADKQDKAALADLQEKLIDHTNEIEKTMWDLYLANKPAIVQ